MTGSLIARAREAASSHAWSDAYALLVEADRAGSLIGEDEAFFADVAYAAGHLDVTLEKWERSYVRSVRADRSAEAAAAATNVAMHLLFDTALMAPVRGWIRKAERWLDHSDETAVHARLAVVCSYERLLSGDFQTARQWARRAIRLGSRFDRGAGAIGQIAEARNLILDGEVGRGLDQLNEAAMTTVTGELDAFSTGVVYCELVCALQALGQYDLAEEWTRAMEHWRHGHAVGSVHGRCRVHRAEILRLRGSIREAEREALLACSELQPYLRREFGWPLTELGLIRLILGDLDASEKAFLEAHQRGWDAQPGLAKLHLARGHIELAARSIQDALENPTTVPSKEQPPNSELRQAPLLDAQVEIAVAAGDLERARWAARRLGSIAERFGSRPHLANAALARGRILLADRRAEGARAELEAAVEHWSEIGAPYEVARARLVLAHAYRLCKNEGRARLELESARMSFQQLGATLDAEQAARAVSGEEESDKRPRTKDAGTAANGAKNAAHSETHSMQQEGEYWTITYRQRTIRMRDLKGIRYLARLLLHPARHFYALDLIALENRGGYGKAVPTEPGLSLESDGGMGPVLDNRAKREYRRRLAEIEQDIEEARSIEDLEREAQAETERELIIRELSKAAGFGGRSRTLHSDAERARVSVTRALRLAITRIRQHDSELGEHFDRTIQTGKFCVYLPNPSEAAEWVVGRS